jgi:hypothetical protein
MSLLTIEPYKSECKPIIENILTDITSIEKAILDMSEYYDKTA